jgi:hypothetical protein
MVLGMEGWCFWIEWERFMIFDGLDFTWTAFMQLEVLMATFYFSAPR